LIILKRRLRDNSETNIFISTFNPLKTVVLLMQFNHILSFQFSFARGQAEEINSMLLKMANKFCSLIHNERDIEIMLLDTTYSGREVIEIIVRHEFIELLKTSVVDNVVSKFWAGAYEREVFP